MVALRSYFPPKFRVRLKATRFFRCAADVGCKLWAIMYFFGGDAVFQELCIYIYIYIIFICCSLSIYIYIFLYICSHAKFNRLCMCYVQWARAVDSSLSVSDWASTMYSAAVSSRGTYKDFYPSTTSHTASAPVGPSSVEATSIPEPWSPLQGSDSTTNQQQRHSKP